jgi:predicted N-formylglutamate amidohydrolase
MKLVLTCEHGGNKIPEEYSKCFENQHAILNTHRGFDLGAQDVFNTLKRLSDFSISSETSRLLIELNRSLHHDNLFSEFSKGLSKEKKNHLINSYYLTYRNKVENKIKELIEAGEMVLHISVHSFTPILNNKERHCDIGLLFDSTKPEEKEYSILLKNELLKIESSLNVRFNYPYLGKSDGFTSYLRKQFPEDYLGIELEFNQKYVKNNFTESHLKQIIADALKKKEPLH